MDIPLRNAGLYAETGTPGFPDAPALRGIRCRCGHPAFPPQRQGCEVCGATGPALADALFEGRGRLMASATVHRHFAPQPPVPFTVVEVEMRDGPVVRGLLAGSAPTDLDPGTELVTVLEEVQIGETRMRDLRFKPLGG